MEHIVKYLKERKFVNTKVDFKEIKMPTSDFNHMFSDDRNIAWISPSVSTKFVLTPENNLFRSATEWGNISNGCYWTLDGEPNPGNTRAMPAVGVCDIDDFTPISQAGARLDAACGAGEFVSEEDMLSLSNNLAEIKKELIHIRPQVAEMTKQLADKTEEVRALTEELDKVKEQNQLLHQANTELAAELRNIQENLRRLLYKDSVN